jgi:hypothetical protein
MKLNYNLVLISLLAASPAVQANWFGSSSSSNTKLPAYNSWSTDQLTSWLNEHNIPVPSSSTSAKHPSHDELVAAVERNWNTATAWTQDQYNAAQKSFSNIKADSFESWDESRLREFLLKQGVIAPKGPREELVLLVKEQYQAYKAAASTLSSKASTAVYGDKTQQASKSATSAWSQATGGVKQSLDDSKDYVYSTWDDSKLREYLESKGVQIDAQAKKNRESLLGYMREAYASATSPIYDAWSDSYLHDWLVSHNVISPTPPSPYSREYLIGKMKEYYYDANEKVYSTWSDIQLRQWLIDNNIIKSDAQVTREKMIKLVDENYASAKTTIFQAWSDSQLREWLVEHGYIDDRNAVQKRRDELLELMYDKYTASTAATAAYLTWPDARLRSYLRLHGISEDYLPTSRPGLLQEVRIRWVQTQTMWTRVKDIVGGVEGEVEDRISKLWSLLKGEGYKAKGEAEKGWFNTKGEAKEGWFKSKGEAEKKWEEGKGAAERKYTDAEKEYERGKAKAYEHAEKARSEL